MTKAFKTLTKNLLIIYALVIFVFCFINSCTKVGKLSVHDMLIAKWKLQTVAIDSNKNGRIETDEITDTNLYINIFKTFNTNGTGFTTYNGPKTYSFSWALSGHDSVLMLTDSLFLTTQSWYLDSISASTLNLYFIDTAGRKEWNIYRRQ